jgi:recombination protein RecR
MPRSDRNPLEDLEGLLRKLPGVGEKSARRLAIFIAKAHEQYSQQLAAAILSVRRKVRECRRCRNFGEQETCAICSDPKRDRDILCVVAGVQDLQSIERSHAFRGVYFVLHGHLSPLEGIGPDDLQAERLEALIREDGTKEVIIATNPSSEGEATASYIAGRLRHVGVRISRIASGVPHGGELEYTDPVSIKSSISGRREY